MHEHQDDLAAIITFETGKPFKESVGEVKYAASYLDFYANEIIRPDSNIGARVTVERNREVHVTKEPVGVCGLITPWNFPLAMIARKV
jgi:succinate-semialdehyde dehydrogenase/glutarate-semialdehyde dehydrogenase